MVAGLVRVLPVVQYKRKNTGQLDDLKPKAEGCSSRRPMQKTEPIKPPPSWFAFADKFKKKGSLNSLFLLLGLGQGGVFSPVTRGKFRLGIVLVFPGIVAAPMVYETRHIRTYQTA